MFGISMWEVMLIFVVALIVLGPKQLVETAKVAGRMYREILRMAGDLRSTVDLESLSSLDHKGSSSYRPPDSSLYPQGDTIPPLEVRSEPDPYKTPVENPPEEQSAKTDGASQTEIKTETRTEEAPKTTTKE